MWIVYGVDNKGNPIGMLIVSDALLEPVTNRLMARPEVSMLVMHSLVPPGFGPKGPCSGGCGGTH